MAKKIIFLIIITVCSVCFGLMAGDPFFSLKKIDVLLFHSHPSLSQTIFLHVRLPRVVAGFITGGLLALSGFIMQVLLQNPLADPYILGISGGSSVLTLSFLVLGFPFWVIKLGNWLGAFISFLFIWLWTRKKKNFDSLLLYGVMQSFIYSAIISSILTLAPEHALKGIIFWLMGNLANVELHFYDILLFGIVFSLTLYLSKAIALLNLGEIKAYTLGLQISRLQIQLIALSCLGIATAVSLAGTMGFIGLMVPHFLRKLGFSHSPLFIISLVLLGGSIVVIADTLARTVFLPEELPVGIFTIFIGAIGFFLIRKQI